jgi:hypothetical protein
MTSDAQSDTQSDANANNYPPIHTAMELETPLTLTFEQALSSLEAGTMQEEIGLMRWGSNYTFLVRIIHDDINFLAIYKPRMGERPLWDFPDGTLCQREAAAFVLSDILHWHIVPPTLLRDGTRGIGSVQVFIQHDPEQHYFTFEGDHSQTFQRLALFDAIANNADRKGGHCLLDPDARLWSIDHGLTFNVAHKLRTVIWDYAGQPIPEALLKDVQTLCDDLAKTTSSSYQRLSALLSDDEMRVLHQRIQKLLSTQTYPMPGSGPNRPWPAV